MKRSIPMFILAAMMATACKPTVPSQYLQPDEMEDILYDYHISQAIAKSENSAQTDYDRTKLFYAVLEKYNTTEAVFDSSLVYYYSHVDRFKPIYARVSGRIASEGSRLGAAVGDINRYSQYNENGDTANIWRGETALMLLPRPTKNRFDFVIKADSTFMVGDSFMFQFYSEHIWQSGNKDAVVCIRTAYEGDSIIQTTGHFSSSGISQIRVPANNTLNIKELKGFIYLADNDPSSDIRKLMFISQIQLIRFHNKEIAQSNENKSESVVKTDSMQRVANPSRPNTDTLLYNTGTGLRGKNAPFRRGDASNRVAPRKDMLKTRE